MIARFSAPLFWMTAGVLVLTAVIGPPTDAAQGNIVPPLAPHNLSCEFLLYPERTAIFDSKPEFGWDCGPFLQSAYQVVLWKDDPSTDQPEVIWDSGKVVSGKSQNVEHGGSPLTADETYRWHVKVWNSAGTESHWSQPQSFRMAVKPSDTETSRYQVGPLYQQARSVDRLTDGTYVCDFGTAAFGYLKLRVPGDKATATLRVHFGEKLSNGRIDREPGGTIRYDVVEVPVAPETTEISIRPPRDRRNTTGDAIRLPNSMGVVAPFRYVEIEADWQIHANDVTQVRFEYPFDEVASDFRSSDETLNDIWELCKYSIRATTFCGVYIDGDRERIPYEADAYINQLSHYGVDREYALARHSHEFLLQHPTWPTEWKQHSVLMAWADYWYTGDTESLERNYEILKQQKTLSAWERPDGLLDSTGLRDIVDWPEGERDGYQMLPVNTVVNAFHYATLKRMARIAGVLNHDADEHAYKASAKRLEQSFNEILWNAVTNRYVDGEGSSHSSLHANLFPLVFGLVPPERKPAVIEFIKSRGMNCSVYAAQFLLEGLYQAGEDDYALELLTSHGQRSWFNMIRTGSTITLEAWDKQFKPNLDWNHAWGAAPANLIPAYLVGVRPLAPGFEKIVVQPRPGRLTFFEARVPSPRGPVEVDYRSDADGSELDVVVPGNSVARVGVPIIGTDEGTVSVSWNGKTMPARVHGQHAWIDGVPPGQHSFRAIRAAAIAQSVNPD